MRNRILSLVLLICLLALPTACAEASGLQVTASFYPMYALLLNLVRDVPGVTVTCLVPMDVGCAHDYQLTTNDRRALDQTDLLVINGAGMEVFLDGVLSQLSAAVVDTSEGLPLLSMEGLAVHGDSLYNEHVWVSLPLAIRQVDAMARALSELDPAHADQYEANRAAYTQRIQALYERMQEALAPYAGTSIVTFHAAFDYFAADFGLNIAAVLRRDAGSAPSAREIGADVDVSRKRSVRALFVEPQYPRDGVDVVARETGLVPYTLDPVATAAEGVADIDAYLHAMEQNLTTLLEALP